MGSEKVRDNVRVSFFIRHDINVCDTGFEVKVWDEPFAKPVIYSHIITNNSYGYEELINKLNRTERFDSDIEGVSFFEYKYTECE